MRMSPLPVRPDPAWWRLAGAAFAAQVSVSLVGWFLVDDRSRGRSVWMTSDVKQWATLSAVCAAVLVVFAGLAQRRWLAASMVAAGCFLAGMSGLTVFVAWAVFNSA
jgi:hypothetical protein